MDQNLYDNPEFFEGYSRLDRSVRGLAGAAEWPAMRSLLPDLKGLAIVDLGCGFGWFCRWAREQGAASVLGIDGSERMLARAELDTKDPLISYERVDLEILDLPERAFDLAYSSLVLHYIKDLARVLFMVYRALVPGGTLVFSVEHPIFSAPERPDWVIDPHGLKYWPLNQYGLEGPRTTNWLAEGVVKQHRMIGTTLNHLITCGFSILHVEEWTPTDEQLQMKPALHDELERPMFLLVAAQKPYQP